jgi:HEAT repeat protein
VNRRSIILTLASLASLGAAAPACAGDVESKLTDDVRSRCVAELVGALDAESQWVRVHAGDALAALNRPERVIAAFRPQADAAGPQYRIGVWRVLALAEQGDRRREYVARIRRAFLDPHGPDQTHAIEALAKLKVPASDDAERQRVRDVAEGGGSAAPFALWRLAQAGDETAVARLASLLDNPDEPTRVRAAYVLGRLQPLPHATDRALSAALAKERAGSVAQSVMRAALGVDAAREMAQDPDAPQYARYSAAMCLAELGRARDHAILSRMLQDPDLDVRVAAAYATLQIDGRAAAASTRPARDDVPR